MSDFGDFGSGENGYGPPTGPPTGSQLAEGALSEAGSAAARGGSPILGWFLTNLGQALFGGGGSLGEDVSFYGRSYSQEDPSTGSWYANPFTTEAYGFTDPFTTGVGSITEVISIGDVPTEASLSDILAPFAAPAPEDDDQRTSSNGQWVRDPNTGFSVPAVLVPNAQSYEDGSASSFGFSSSTVLPDAPDPIDTSLPRLPSQPLSQPTTATGQPTPPVTSSTASPVAFGYNPTAGGSDEPNVYVPPSYPPIDTWPTAGSSAPTVASSPATLTPPPTAVGPIPPNNPQTTEAPGDFSNTWFGDAMQTEGATFRPRVPAPITAEDSRWPDLPHFAASALPPSESALPFQSSPREGGYTIPNPWWDDAVTRHPVLSWLGLTVAGTALYYGGSYAIGGLGGLPGLYVSIGRLGALVNELSLAQQGIAIGVGAGGAAALRQSDEIPPLASELDDVITLNQLFGQKVQQAATLLREATGIERDDLMRQWLWPDEYASYADGALQAANEGKVIERMVATDLALDSRTSAYFAYVGSSGNVPDFYGLGRLEGFFWDVTTFLDKAPHESEVERWYASRTFVWGYSLR